MDEIHALKHRLEQLLPEVELYVFGSRARGDFYPDSDVDLAIVTPAFEGKTSWSATTSFARISATFSVQRQWMLCCTPRKNLSREPRDSSPA